MKITQHTLYTSIIDKKKEIKQLELKGSVAACGLSAVRNNVAKIEQQIEGLLADKARLRYSAELYENKLCFFDEAIQSANNILHGLEEEYSAFKKLDTELSDGSSVLSEQTLIHVFQRLWDPIQEEMLHICKCFRKTSVAFRKASIMYLEAHPIYYPTILISGGPDHCEVDVIGDHKETIQLRLAAVYNHRRVVYDLNIKKPKTEEDPYFKDLSLVRIESEACILGMLVRLRSTLYRLGGRLIPEQQVKWGELPVTKLTIVDSEFPGPLTCHRMLKGYIRMVRKDERFGGLSILIDNEHYSSYHSPVRYYSGRLDEDTLNIFHT